mmetsp:Transcript_7790/g.9391  ORF Transcript_7790/g.9391 Transcript_7790/m.9391 type:complete len:132 (-) Transcript_7790:698-1093(-)
MLPKKLKGNISKVIKVSAWGEFSMALKQDGSVYTWGANARGRTGHPEDVKMIDRPTKVAALKNIVEISAGYWHSLALDNRGKIFSAGNNKDGELGREGASSGFAEVASPEGVTFAQIFAGFSVSFAIDTAG